jgi:serine protease
MKSRLILAFSGISALAACGGGGGSSSPAPTASIAGQLRMPQAAAARIEHGSADALRPMVAGEVCVWLDDPRNPPDLTAQGLDLLRAPGGPIAIYQPRAATVRLRIAQGAAPDSSAEQATVEAAAAVAAHPNVRAACPNYLLQALRAPNDTHFGKQWHADQIHLQQAWDVTIGSSSVIVAILDTGIVSDHPDFDPARFVPGFDMISSASAARDGNGRDNDPEDVGDLATPQGSSFHGTHVAGTIGARTDNGAGIAGVDWACKLMPVRVLGRGGGSIDDIANGILFAAGLTNASGTLPAQRADIVNMSLGAPGLISVLETACDAASAAGVLLVAAAGNDNTGNPGSPAAFASVLSVGAVDLVRQRAPYSNFHTSIDLWAPGGDMTTDRNNDGFADGVLSCMADDANPQAHFFAFENGTSMASPHVAGVAALVKAANPGLTAAGIRAVLLANTPAGVNLPNSGRLLDAQLAVQAGAGGAGSTPVFVASPAAVDFSTGGTTAELALENRGGGNLVVSTTVTADPVAPWLNVSVQAVAGTGIDRSVVELTVDRSGLADGVRQTELTFSATDGTTTFTAAVEVRMQVGAGSEVGDTIFVLLVDATTLDPVRQTETTSLADFAYTVSRVPAGDYLLFAGTDRDDDGFLGDAGELLGAFPDLDSPLEITMARGEVATDVDFSVLDLGFLSRPERQRPVLARLR